MTEAKASRGRPRVAPEDNETRERILNTAERLFAEKGFSKVTLRELTARAETNLAAVNYYFGSKDKLLLALIRRAAKGIYRERMELLAEAEQARGSREEKVRQVIYALVAPAVAAPDNEAEYFFGVLIARTLADGPDELSDILLRQTSHLTPFADALKKLLPEVPMEEIFWRLHFVLNIEHAIHTELGRLTHLSGGRCDIDDRSALLERIIDFAVPGLMAPVKSSPSTPQG